MTPKNGPTAKSPAVYHWYLSAKSSTTRRLSLPVRALTLAGSRMRFFRAWQAALSLAQLGGHVGLLGEVLAGEAADLLLEPGEPVGRVAVAEDVHRVEAIDPVADGVEGLAMHLPLGRDGLVAELGHLVAEAHDAVLDEPLALGLQAGLHQLELLGLGPPLLQLQLDILDRGELRGPGDLERRPGQAELANSGSQWGVT